MKIQPARVAPLLALNLFCLAAAPLLAASPTPLPAPSSAQSLFKARPFGPNPPATPTPTPRHITLEEEKPIPAGWWIGAIAVAVLIVVALLYAAVRAWRSANIFDRQYRFPQGGDAALRFGGMRSGGHMATMRFSETKLPPASEVEDA